MSLRACTACRLLLAGHCLAFAACSRAEGPTRRVVGEGDDGKVIEAAVGDRVDVRLRASPGTGYSWEVVGAETCLKLLSSSAEGPVPNRPGGPALAVFHFEAKSGRCELTVHYRRPWEKGIAPARIFRVKVIVR